MTAKEKALDLVQKFEPHVTTWDCYNDTPELPEHIRDDGKKCALIAVEEVLDLLGGAGVFSFADYTVSAYWELVKVEIENL